MRILITGGTGLLGWWIAREFYEKGFDVYTTFYSKQPVGLEGVSWVHLDLESIHSVVKVFKDVKPDIVVHSAAYTDVDGCEIHRDRAYRVNYLGTKALAKLCRDQGIYMIYISTDYVFDGVKGMYVEEDIPNPVNFYGLSKLLGEIAVDILLENRYCIVRVSGLYGYSPTGKKNFGINVLEKLLHSEEVKAFYDQYLSPTYVPFLAQNIVKLVEKEIRGVIHIAGERISRYEFALLVAKALNKDTKLVKKISIEELKLLAKRPRDSSLDTSKARSLNIAIPPHEECIKHFIDIYKAMKSNR